MKRKLMTILEVNKKNALGEIVWQKFNLPNTVHLGGDYFMLSALFASISASIPASYYLGLDNRTIPAESDTLANLSQEPSQFAYARQAISSGNGFSVALNGNGVYQATSTVVAFIATGGSWGPVSNLFLSTTVNNSGYLIATSPLDDTVTVGSGEQLTLRFALTLRDINGV